MRLFMGLAVVCAASCADHAKHSVSLYEAGDYAGAARAADEGLTAHPSDPGLWGMRVRAALALGDADGIAKAYAAYLHERGDDDRALLLDLADATIGQALASPSARLQLRAIGAVEDLELEDLANEVFEHVNADDDRVAAAAAVAVLHGFGDAPKVAKQMLRSDSAEARRIALEGVAKKLGKITEGDLEVAAGDNDARVRAAALHWLGMLRDADAVEVCTQRLHDPDATVRAAAASALAQIGLGNLEAAARLAAEDKVIGVRLAAIELYAAAHADGALAALAAEDKDARVALAAALAVKKTRPELASQAIARAAADADWTTRAAAANEAIAAVGKDAALAIALRLGGDKELAVRLAAARALAHLGDDAHAEAILRPEHDLDAIADLAALDGEGLDQLSMAVRDLHRTPDQRAQAAAAHVAARHVTPGLVAALADPNGLVRIEAAAALGRLAK